jgi:hypothetical protein
MLCPVALATKAEIHCASQSDRERTGSLAAVAPPRRDIEEIIDSRRAPIVLVPVWRGELRHLAPSGAVADLPALLTPAACRTTDPGCHGGKARPLRVRPTSIPLALIICLPVGGDAMRRIGA